MSELKRKIFLLILIGRQINNASKLIACYTIKKFIVKRRKWMEVETVLDLLVNQGFPIALSILLIFRIDRFKQEIVKAQKEGYRQILEHNKEIYNTITGFNRENREYCALHFSEVQKELTGMKVELGKIE